MNDIVALIHARVLQRAGHFGGDIHDQRAAKGDVEQLLATANRQQRLVLPVVFVDQDQFAQVTFAAVGGGFYGFAELGRDAVLVKPGFDVIAAGDEDAIGAIDAFGDELAGIAHGQSERQSAGSSDGALIGLG